MDSVNYPEWILALVGSPATNMVLFTHAALPEVFRLLFNRFSSF
jgi:hypothetical protein